MANEWFYTRDGQPSQAPATSAQLQQLATGGQLLPTDMVWREGMANWAPASSIKGLFATPKAAAEPVPAVEQPGRRTPVPPTRAQPAREAAVPDFPMPTADPPRRAASSAGPPGLHPLLVLLLSVVTLGGFGLYYAYRVCKAFPPKGARRADASGKPAGRPRHPLGVMLLAYLTLGFSFYFWVANVLRECGEYTGRRDFHPRTELTLMLLFPPYAIYVAVFRLPILLRATLAQANVPEPVGLNSAVVFLNPLLFPVLPLLAMLYQDALNQAWLAEG